MIDDKSRFQKAIGLTLGVHLAAAAVLGAFFWSPLNVQDNKILEVALAGAPPKKAAKPVAKPKVIIKPKADDIIDKRLKPPPKEPVQETKKEEDTDGPEEGSGTSNGSSGSGNQPTQQPGQAVTLPYITYSTVPPYPSEARKNGIQGTVRVKVLIDTNGRVANASISSGSGSSLLDQAALQTVYKWRFSPAKDAKGKKVRCYVTIPVVYRLKK